MIRCLPEPSDRVYFQAAVVRFDAGEHALIPWDTRFLQTQRVLEGRFTDGYSPSVPCFQLERDYQRVFALYWECREAKG